MENHSFHQGKIFIQSISMNSSFFQHLPRRLFNSKFLCRATNRLGSNEQSMTILEKHSSLKRPRPTTPLMYYSTSSSDSRLLTTTSTNRGLMIDLCSFLFFRISCGRNGEFLQSITKNFVRFIYFKFLYTFSDHFFIIKRKNTPPDK